MAEQLAMTMKVGDTVFRTVVFHGETDERGDFYVTMTEEGHFSDESVSAKLDAAALTRLIDMLVKLRSSAWRDNATTKAGDE